MMNGENMGIAKPFLYMWAHLCVNTKWCDGLLCMVYVDHTNVLTHI